MRDPGQPLFDSFKLLFGFLVAVVLAPVGQGALAESTELATPISAPEAAAAPPPLTGRQVYNAVCVACHAPPGIGGAPALGDGDAWAPRIAQGVEALTDHALHGFSGDKGIMPSKGGRLDLSDEEIIEAVEYMVELAAQ